MTDGDIAAELRDGKAEAWKHGYRKGVEDGRRAACFLMFSRWQLAIFALAWFGAQFVLWVAAWQTVSGWVE